VERLLPYRRRPDHLGGDCWPPPPIPGADGRPEHEVAELLRFKMRYSRPHVLVRWAGSDASGDTWEPLDNLTNCEEAIAAFEQATGRSLPRPAPPPPAAAAAAPPPPFPPAGFTVDAAPPGDLGAPLVGRTLLYWWPDDGWQRGTVARTCPRGAFSHVVAYHRQTSALRYADTAAVTVTPRPALLDAARLPRPGTAPAGCFSPRLPQPGSPAPCDLEPPDPDFGFGRWLVTARGAGRGCPRAGPSNGCGQRPPDLKAVECSALFIYRRAAKRNNKRFVSIWGPRLPNSRAHFPSLQIRHLF
jgi:hypothetical protein